MDKHIMDLSSIAFGGDDISCLTPMGGFKKSIRMSSKPKQEGSRNALDQRTPDDDGQLHSGDTIASEADSLAQLLRTEDGQPKLTQTLPQQSLFNVHSTPARPGMGLLDEDLDCQGSDSSLLLDVHEDRLVEISPQAPPQSLKPVLVEVNGRILTPDDDPFSMTRGNANRTAYPCNAQHIPMGLLIDISPQSNSRIHAAKLTHASSPSGVLTRSKARKLQFGYTTDIMDVPKLRVTDTPTVQNENTAPTCTKPFYDIPSDSNSVVKTNPKTSPETTPYDSHEPIGVVAAPLHQKPVILSQCQGYQVEVKSESIRPFISFEQPRRQTVVGVVKPQQVEPNLCQDGYKNIDSELQKDENLSAHKPVRRPITTDCSTRNAASFKPPTGSTKPASRSVSTRPSTGNSRSFRTVQPVVPPSSKVSAVTAKRMSLGGTQRLGSSQVGGRCEPVATQQATSTGSRVSIQPNTSQTTITKTNRRQSFLNLSKPPLEKSDTSTKPSITRANRQSLLPSDLKAASTCSEEPYGLAGNSTTRARRQSLLPSKFKPTTPPSSRVTRRQSLMPSPRVAASPSSVTLARSGYTRPVNKMVNTKTPIDNIPTTPGSKQPVTRMTRQSLLPPHGRPAGGMAAIQQERSGMAHTRRSVSAGLVPITSSRSGFPLARTKIGGEVSDSTNTVSSTQRRSKRLSTSLPGSAR